MSFRTALKNWFGFYRSKRVSRSRPESKKSSRSRLLCERLEDRTVPAVLDLTVAPLGLLNNGKFELINQQPAGSGVIDSFVRLHALGSTDVTPEGHNTSGRNQGSPKLNFDENSSPVFTHDLRKNDIPKVRVDNVWYREFRLDLNDPNNSSAPPVSLNKFKLFYKNQGGALATPTELSGELGTLIWDMDGNTASASTNSGADSDGPFLGGSPLGNWVNMNDRNHGSGQADLRVLVPDNLFPNGNSNPYIYLYSRFGDTQAMTGGYEEWYVGPAQREEAVDVVTYIHQDGQPEPNPALPPPAVTNVPLASTVHDHAYVYVDGTTTPITTGSVTFSFWTNDSCSGDPASTYTDTYGADGWSTPSTLPLHAGGYSYAARYNGVDGSFTPGVSECEPLRVGRGVLLLRTDIHGPHPSHAIVLSVPLGTSVHDNAHFIPGGPYLPGFEPGGTVTYTFNGPGGFPQTDALNPDGSIPESGPTGPLAAGNYVFNASYTHGPNAGGFDDYENAQGLPEPLEVRKADITITTQVHDSSHNNITNSFIVGGQYVHDNATLNGTVASYPADGTVTYYFYTNGTCSGTPLSSQTVIVVNGVVPESTPIIPPSGTNSYKAVYNGGTNYNASPDSDCEPFMVLAAQDGRTPGFWQNPVGNPLITDADLAALRALNLVNEDGSPFNPTTREQVGVWITSQANENMAYKLSSFLAAMTLNVRHGFNDATGLVYSPQFGNTGPGGQFIVLGDLLTLVNNELAAHPYTPNDPTHPGSAFRAYQAALAELLDALCNNQALFLP